MADRPSAGSSRVGVVADGQDGMDRAAALGAASAAGLNGLPSVRAAAAAVIGSADGRVLLVDPVYKPQWELPGGAAEVGESPLEACRREVAEELAIDITPRRLLCVDHQMMRPPRRGALRFVFDGGHLDERSLAAIRLPPDELNAWKLVAVDELHAHLKPSVAERVRRGLAAPGAYLENGIPLLG